MRAKEFISEGRQRIDELGPLVIAGWALTAGTAAWQAYDTYNDFQTYNASEKTEADLNKLKAAVGMDALAIVAGGAAGKLVGKTISLGATPFKAVKNIYNARKAADAAKKAAEKAAKAANKGDAAAIKAAEKAAEKAKDAANKVMPKAADKVVPKAKPGSVVTSKQGNKKIAGADGKPTTVNPSDKAGIAKIKKAAEPTTVTGKVGAVASKVVDKAKDVAGKLKPKKPGGKTVGAAAGKVKPKNKPGSSAAGAAAGKLAKKKLPSKVGKPAGKIAGKTGSKVGKPLGKKLLPYAAGALAGKSAKAGYDALSNLGKEFDDWNKNRDGANTTGDNSYIYTGDKKDPPKSDFVAKNLDLEKLKVKK